jgi:hypothetical protein
VNARYREITHLRVHPDVIVIAIGATQFVDTDDSAVASMAPHVSHRIVASDESSTNSASTICGLAFNRPPALRHLIRIRQSACACGLLGEKKRPIGAFCGHTAELKMQIPNQGLDAVTFQKSFTST